MILRSEDYKRMPWKNGGGETLEIAVFPEGASVGNFDWRISMATVSADGGFSTFPGIDRIITILDGDAITLSIEGSSPVLLDQTSAPYAFPGDAATMGHLRTGPIADLNVMVRRGLDHSVTRIDIRDLPRNLASHSTRFLVALEAVEFRVKAETIALQRLDCIDLSNLSSADVLAESSAAGLLITIGR